MPMPQNDMQPAADQQTQQADPFSDDFVTQDELALVPEATRSKILWESRQSAIVMAILDRLDSKTREGYTLWLTEMDAGKAETIRQRASAVADFRSELVAGLYAKSPAERRQETLRRGQDHARIYLDNQQSNALSSGRS